MEVKDGRGKTVEIGSFIRYIGTGTIGKVIDIKRENSLDWIKLENPELWYSSETVELIDEKNIENNKDKYQKEKDINDVKDLSDDLDDISLISGGAEGGG